MSPQLETFEPDHVEFSRDDSRRIAMTHQRTTGQYVTVWNDETMEIEERYVELPEPICANCRESWGREGCPTTRALVLIGIQKRTIAANARKIEELTEALTPRFGVGRLRDPQNRLVELRMQIDQYTLIQGGIGVVDLTLRKMGREFRAWFKKVGDLERIRADHALALTMDTRYYTHITQEFDPSASFEKERFAQWDTTPWDMRP